jgi:hypothetical protein
VQHSRLLSGSRYAARHFSSRIFLSVGSRYAATPAVPDRRWLMVALAVGGVFKTI